VTTQFGLSYSLTGAPDTNAGSYYPVTATITDPNYTGSASGNFKIDPAPVTVTLGNLEQTYTGSALSPSATTAPTGLSYSLTGAPDTNAGSYTVTAAITNPNYKGSTSGTFKIDPVPYTLALSNLSQIYTGAGRPVTVSFSGSAACAVTVTYNGSPTAPTSIGTYSVMASVANSNCVGQPATGTLVISAFGSTCIYALDHSAAQSFSASGGSAIVAQQCGIQVNSSSPDAFDVSGGNTSVKASSIGITGGSQINGNASVLPSPLAAQAAVPDPLAGVTAPAVGSACDFTDWHNASSTLNPGVYCGGINISGGLQVTLNPGTYILLGGGLSISGNAGATGTNVTFYNTGNATHAYKPIAISGNSQLSLAAPRSGPLAGVLIFQDRAISDKSQNAISGGSGTVLEGTLYFPTTPLVYSGGSKATHGAYTVIVADTVTFTGGSSSFLAAMGQ
jgi:drug/metabolite transporter superfamily protein YnfA